VQEFRQRIEAEKQELLCEERRKAAEGQKLLRELLQTKRNKALQKMDELLERKQQQSLNMIKSDDRGALPPVTVTRVPVIDAAASPKTSVSRDQHANDETTPKVPTSPDHHHHAPTAHCLLPLPVRWCVCGRCVPSLVCAAVESYPMRCTPTLAKLHGALAWQGR
jgi:hypothetical protein